MRTKPTSFLTPSPKKKVYQKPVLTVLGSIKRLTLKSGSSVDGFGTFG
ncbi:lasso RiPP family leader peptide-containing protein [Spirosoma pulveris]